MPIKEILAIAAPSLRPQEPYVVDIVKSRVEPHADELLVCTVVSAITFFGQVAKGRYRKNINADTTTYSGESATFTCWPPSAAILTWLALLIVTGE